jgi:hypothetical protein
MSPSTISPMGVDTHLITAHAALPSLLRGDAGC